ncbi:putative Mid2 domain-containing protein [Seiridium unicorne]|uniref:Mid2 domain-containing protein n=1 Tax=Seiridium unicorne TaxID=138068 RepID=A0ABR2V7P2_9PEZI
MSTTTSTLIGALTTTYTPSGSICGSIHYDTNPTPPGWYALGAIAEDSTSCMPTGFTRAAQYYYSPGICPSSYTPACWSVETTESVLTTKATCCPTGYVCKQNRGSNIYGCTSAVTEDTTFTLLSVSFGTITAESTTSYGAISGTITTAVSASDTYINAYGVIVARQSTDPPFTSAATTTTSNTGASNTNSIASETSAASSTTAASSSSSTSSSSAGLSTGAKAGIGVGVALAAIAMLVLVFIIFRRKRKAKNASAVGTGGNPEVHHYTDPSVPQQPFLPSSVPPYSEQAYAAPYKDQRPGYDHQVSELSHDALVSELPANNWNTAEMPGDSRYHK